MNSDERETLATSLKLVNDVKHLIICASHTLLSLQSHHPLISLTGEARAIFAAHNAEPAKITTPAPSPRSHTYDVLIDKRRNGEKYEYRARLILYTSYTEWKVLIVNPSECMSPADAMLDLLEEAFKRVGMKRGE
jgi:hypothetical protein